MSGGDMGRGEFAGRLREPVTLRRAGGARDALGAAAGSWVTTGSARAAIEPAGSGPATAGDAPVAAPLWRITLRPCELAVGDRIEWRGAILQVRELVRDPALPDRLVAIGEEQR